jgi:hypothetical protein
MFPALGAVLGLLHPVARWVLRRGLNFQTFTNILNKFFNNSGNVWVPSRIAVKDWLLNLTETLHSAINNLTMKYIIYNWHKTFTIHVPNLITVGFLTFINYPRTFLHLNQRTNWHTSDHTPSHILKVPGSVDNGLKGINLRWCSVSSSSVVAEHTTAFKCPSVSTDKYLKDWCRVNVGLYL